jgi:WD40 repeat protein
MVAAVGVIMDTTTGE